MINLECELLLVEDVYLEIIFLKFHTHTHSCVYIYIYIYIKKNNVKIK